MTLIAAGARHSLARGVVEDHPVLCLESHDEDLRVTIAPGLGSVVCSLPHRGEELLGRRSGLGPYATRGETMGVPLLYPWANRLGATGYRFGGREVELDGLTPLDASGLPIHGLLAAIGGWRVTDAGADEGGAWAGSELDVGARPDVLRGFPFPHVVRVDATLRGRTLTIETTVRPTGAVRVPVSFGYHPYLRLPGVPREAWAIDGYLAANGLPFALAGGGCRIEVVLEAGYPFAQVFAPCDDEVLCFEPMTAPANALRVEPPSVAPGETYRAQFSITVSPW